MKITLMLWKQKKRFTEYMSEVILVNWYLPFVRCHITATPYTELNNNVNKITDSIMIPLNILM